MVKMSVMKVLLTVVVVVVGGDEYVTYECLFRGGGNGGCC